MRMRGRMRPYTDHAARRKRQPALVHRAAVPMACHGSLDVALDAGANAECKPEWLVEIAPHYYKKKELEDTVGKKLPKVAGRAQLAT